MAIFVARLVTSCRNVSWLRLARPRGDISKLLDGLSELTQLRTLVVIGNESIGGDGALLLSLLALAEASNANLEGDRSDQSHSRPGLSARRPQLSPHQLTIALPAQSLRRLRPSTRIHSLAASFHRLWPSTISLRPVSLHSTSFVATISCRRDDQLANQGRGDCQRSNAHRAPAQTFRARDRADRGANACRRPNVTAHDVSPHLVFAVVLAPASKVNERTDWPSPTHFSPPAVSTIYHATASSHTPSSSMTSTISLSMTLVQSLRPRSSPYERSASSAASQPPKRMMYGCVAYSTGDEHAGGRSYRPLPKLAA